MEQGKMMRYLKVWVWVLLAAVLTACGGGGNPGAGGNSGAGGATTPTPTRSTVANFYIYTDKTIINNSGTDKVVLTVVAVNANNNIVVGAAVSVSADKDTIFTPSAGAVTNGAGSYVGSISMGSDKSDRDITVTVAVSGLLKQTVIRVSGSKLTLQATPSIQTPGAVVEVSAKLLDYANAPISGADITFTGTLTVLQGQVIKTDPSGIARKSFVAPAATAVYTIGATGSGVLSADRQLKVVSSGGIIPAALISLGSLPSLSASPNILSVNSLGSTTNKSTLRFLFLDSSNSPIPNVRVRFDDVTSGLPKVGASLSSGTQTLYTDSSGIVSTQYVPGQNSSPTNGVAIHACYSATDFSSTTDCPAYVFASLTVAGKALSISIGNDNLLTRGSGTYIKTFTITVADSAGRAVAGAPVDISVDLTHYGKGEYSSSYKDVNGAAVIPLSVVPSLLADSYPSITTDPSSSPQRVWCANEDTNRNGNVDPGENVNGSVDSNNQSTLTPRKSDLIVSYSDPAVTTTNSSGILLIKVEYSQRFATWLAYRVRVTTDVSGSQGLGENLFQTTFLVGDDANGSFLTPPYGYSACNDAS